MGIVLSSFSKPSLPLVVKQRNPFSCCSRWCLVLGAGHLGKTFCGDSLSKISSHHSWREDLVITSL